MTSLGAALCVGYGYFIEPQRLVVRRAELPIEGWDPAFDGYRIVVMSDIHGGSNGSSPENLRAVVETANASDADAIVLLGDFVSQFRENKPITERTLRMPMNEIADLLAPLRARDGVFAVLGNHDWWYSEATVAAELRRVGFNVLEDELFTVKRGDRELNLLGLRDHMNIGSWEKFNSDAKRIVSVARGNIVVLEHSPDVIPFLTAENAISPNTKLLLAGHTHGGQVSLPILGSPIIPSNYGQKYAHGHVFDRGLDIWITSGIGTSILPVRFMVPPEIVVLTIRST